MCRSIEMETKDLSELCQNGMGDTDQAVGIARSVASKLDRLKDVIRTALVDRVVEDFMDAGTSLKQFTDCVLKPADDVDRRDAIFEEKAGKLMNFSEKAVGTAKMVAVGTKSGNKKVAEALISHSNQVYHLMLCQNNS